MRSFLPFLLALLLFASCRSLQNFSIEKRHYRTGYHIDLSRGHIPNTEDHLSNENAGIKRQELKYINYEISTVPGPELEHLSQRSSSVKASLIPTLSAPQPIAPLPTDSDEPAPTKKKGIGLPGLAITGAFMGDAGLALGYFTSFLMPWVIIAISLFFLGIIFIMTGMHIRQQGPHDSCSGILVLLCMVFIPLYVIGYIIYKAIKSSVNRHH
ncbi:MAG TPA: hypothetical protein VI112_03855 [Bacteroidia bacterium]|jgi:hypothetical protein